MDECVKTLSREKYVRETKTSEQERYKSYTLDKLKDIVRSKYRCNREPKTLFVPKPKMMKKVFVGSVNQER